MTDSRGSGRPAALAWQDDAVRTRGGRTIPVRATARRPTWADLPSPVRDAIESLVGGRVSRADSVGTGFTPGFASRLTLSDGRRVFVKAAAGAYDRTHGWELTRAYREEIRKLTLLPTADLHAPALLWCLDEQIADDHWVVVGLQWVSGRPPRRPWLEDELTLVCQTLTEIAPAMASVPDGLALDTFEADFGEWTAWLDQLRDRDGESGWLDRLGELAAESIERCRGTGMAHLDLRDDNVLIDEDRQVWICDWNFPLLAAPWIDLVCILLSAHGDGLDVDRVVDWHPLTRDVEPRSIDCLLANLWLYFASATDRPVPEFSPYLRDHQRWYAESTAGWLERRIGIEPPR